MQIFLYILIGTALGALIVFLLMQMKIKGVKNTLMLTSLKLDQAERDKNKAEQQVEDLDARAEDLRGQLQQAELQLERVNTQLDAERSRVEGEAKMRQEQFLLQQKAEREQFEQQVATVREQFQTLAANIMKHTSVQLKDENKEAMKGITDPLKMHLEQLQQAIADTNKESAKSTASLSEQLREMSRQTVKVNESATKLASVLKGANQYQGKWGERILTDILDAQGFRRGTDYDTQQTITDEHGRPVKNDDNGQKMIPDVILHYPMNEDVVIDSKMSISAYYDYVNTEDETLRQQYADALVRSIRNQMNMLAKKDYSSYVKPPRTAIDFVIMFVPNEGALQLALATDPRLWTEAFDKKVFITSQQNLMAVLKMIQMAWRQYNQTENQKHVFLLAEELMKRVGDFVKKFEKVGTRLASLQEDYNEAYKKAFTGRQSIVQKANELKEIGIKENANYPIPQVEPDINEVSIQPEEQSES